MSLFANVCTIGDSVLVVAKKVGSVVGVIEVGDAVVAGLEEGAFDGVPIGEIDGAHEGIAVGDLLGDCDGNFVGEDCVGDADGDTDD